MSITLSELFNRIDQIADNTVAFFVEIAANVPKIKEKLDKLGQTVSQEEIDAVQADLNAIETALFQAIQQFSIISPTKETPELPGVGEPVEPRPVDLPVEIADIELPVDVTDNDNIGIPGVPILDFE